MKRRKRFRRRRTAGAVYEQQIHEELLRYFDALLQNDLGINARDVRIDIGIQDGEAVVGDITVYVDEADLTEAGAYLSQNSEAV